MSYRLALVLAPLASAFAFPALAQATPCDAMAHTVVKGGSVDGAVVVAAGGFRGAADAEPADRAAFVALPAFCKVDATLRPSADSEIHIELWLPLKGWNGKLVESGNGAFSSAFAHAAMARSLAAGYAATSSDTGHTGNSAAFVTGHPEKLIDFGYRAVHENALAAKVLVRAFYGRATAHAYFSGCSTGGRQAYGEAQRYPGDFDGIVAGDPGINFTHQTGAELFTVQSVAANPASIMSARQLAHLHEAVMAACDGLDGVRDGVLENPLQCRFAPATLRCKAVDDTTTCLTPAQVALANRIYDGAVGKDGTRYFPGLTRGTERGWGFMLMRTEPLEYGLDAFRLVVMDDPSWSFRAFDIDADIAKGDAGAGRIVNNYETDLKPFFARGGKLLGYHGWADPQTTPLSSIAYWREVKRTVGDAATDRSYRLFLIPGMGHCEGGDGTDRFDAIAALDRWVSGGQPPVSIPAARIVDGRTVRTRPICAYPRQAIYSGHGSTDVAANFSCGVVKPQT